jgi:hypothetical protein
MSEERTRWSWTKKGCVTVLAMPFLWLGLLWLGGRSPETVAEGERSYRYGRNTSFGYWVGRYRLGDGFRIGIWAGSSLRMSFDVPGIELVRVRKQSWLAGDRAILLEIDYVYHDSIDFPGTIALVYDFERGELHSCGELSAWFVWEPEGQRNRKMTRAEFDGVVAGLRLSRR